jgi:hypothetical protein
MAFSLFPAFIRVLYSTAYGVHTMTLPTNEWTVGDIASPSGYFSAHLLGVPVGAETMLLALLDKAKPFVSTLVNFGRYTIYTMESADGPQIPRYSNAISVTGTATANALDESCQLTFHFKTSDSNDSKLTFLDATRLDTFNKILNPLDFANVPDLVTEWTADTNAWRGRDGKRPFNIVSITATLNRKLRQGRRDA